MEETGDDRMSESVPVEICYLLAKQLREATAIVLPMIVCAYKLGVQ